MKRVLLAMVIFASLAVLLAQPVVMNALISFLFAGVVPGTSYTLPFWLMETILIVIGLILLGFLSRQTLYIGDTAYAKKRAGRAARAKIARDISRRGSAQSKATPTPAAASTRTKRRYQPVAN